MAFRMRAYGTPYSHIYWGLSDEVPNLWAWLGVPPPHDDHEVADDPVFVSPSRTVAKRWLYHSVGANYREQSMPVAAGTMEWVYMKTPGGVEYVYGLGDNGLWYTEQFDSGSPRNRRVVSTVMHKGQNLWVSDPRRKPPIGGV